MEIMGFGSVAAITVICYLLAEALKATALPNKWLPVCCGILGGALGIVGIMTMSEFPASDTMTAMAVGIVSGLAATGSNQIWQQLKGNKEE